MGRSPPPQALAALTMAQISPKITCLAIQTTYGCSGVMGACGNHRIGQSAGETAHPKSAAAAPKALFPSSLAGTLRYLSHSQRSWRSCISRDLFTPAPMMHNRGRHESRYRYHHHKQNTRLKSDLLALEMAGIDCSCVPSPSRYLAAWHGLTTTRCSAILSISACSCSFYSCAHATCSPPGCSVCFALSTLGRVRVVEHFSIAWGTLLLEMVVACYFPAAQVAHSGLAPDAPEEKDPDRGAAELTAEIYSHVVCSDSLYNHE